VKLHQIIRKGIIVSLLYGIAAFGGYLARLFFSRYVSLESFGLFYSVLTFVLAFSIFCDISFGQVLQVYIPELRKKRLWGRVKGYVMVVLCWQVITRVLVITFLIMTAHFFAENYFKIPQATGLIYLFSFAFLLSGFGSFSAGIVGFHRFGTAAFLNLFRIVSFLLGMFAVFWFRQDVIVTAGAYVVSVLATDALTFILFLKQAMPNFFRVRMVLDWLMIKQMFAFGLLLTISSLASQVIGMADTLILTYFRPLSELGVYQMALPTATVVTFLIAWPVGLMIPATLAHLGRARQKQVIVEVRTLLLAAVVPIAAILAVLSGDVLQFLFSQSSTLGSWMLRLLAINQTVFLLVQFSIGVLTGLKKAKELLRMSIIVSIAVIVLSILGVIVFGSLGTIVGYFLSFCIFLALAERSMRQACGASLQWRFVLKILSLGLLCAGTTYAVSLLALPLLLKLIVAGSAGLLVYTVGALISGVVRTELIRQVLQR
jgi:O-antigen/teichoic acid export membrane protein